MGTVAPREAGQNSVPCRSSLFALARRRGNSAGGVSGRADAPACYGADLPVGEFDLEPLRLLDFARAPQRSLLLVPHEREAPRQHAAIAHCAQELPGGEKLSAPHLQAFVIGARHARGKALHLRRLLAPRRAAL